MKNRCSTIYEPYAARTTPFDFAKFFLYNRKLLGKLSMCAGKALKSFLPVNLGVKLLLTTITITQLWTAPKRYFLGSLYEACRCSTSHV